MSIDCKPLSFPHLRALTQKKTEREKRKHRKWNGREKCVIGCEGVIKFCWEKIDMLLMFTFKKLSFPHSDSHPVQLIFDPFKENVKQRLPAGHKAGKDIKDSSTTN